MARILGLVVARQPNRKRGSHGTPSPPHDGNNPEVPFPQPTVFPDFLGMGIQSRYGQLWLGNYPCPTGLIHADDPSVVHPQWRQPPSEFVASQLNANRSSKDPFSSKGIREMSLVSVQGFYVGGEKILNRAMLDTKLKLDTVYRVGMVCSDACLARENRKGYVVFKAEQLWIATVWSRYLYECITDVILVPSILSIYSTIHDYFNDREHAANIVEP